MAVADMALAGLQWVASPIVNKLLTDASSYLDVDMPRELQELETTVLPQFDLVIAAAEKSPCKGKMKAWLQRFKEAFYDAEDLLDEHEYNQLKHKARSGKDSLLREDGSSTSSTILKPFRAAKSKASNLLPIKRLISKMGELKSILAEAKDFRKLLGLPSGNTAGCAPVPTATVSPVTSLAPSKVFGRDTDRNHIVDLLINNKTAADGSSTGYSGVAIVAHGGAGKSTLAQYVYNDERVKETFDLRMWVSISRKLDVQRHTREIIESAAKGECPHISNLDTLQSKLRDILQKSEKFLLVLDDVWFQESDNETEWHDLVAPLVSQQAGSKVLVTSRQDVLPAALSCKVVRLENMEDAELLALFKHHAFSGAEIGDRRLREKLEEIAEKIVKRLGHSPLATKVVGSQLSRKKDMSTWKNALTNTNLSEPMRALLWSFEKLDPTLQRCFLYCCLFPKGHKYQNDELVRLWVAEGLIVSCNQNRILEDIGRDYFSVMVSGSFFQPVSDGLDPAYVMHDLFHDLAESLSKEDCFRLEDDNVEEIPCTVRHLSVRVESMKRHKQSICKLHHLRTVICIDPLMDDVSDVFDQIFQNLKRLRVLYLSCYNSSKLPQSVGELKHLRYLNLIKTLISELPRSLSTLYHLQMLLLSNLVKTLPDKLCNLSKLRHLEVYDDRMDQSFERELPQIPNIGKLTLLQKLRVFCVQKKKGYELRQLRDMNELCGSLRITNLENVTGKDEAVESKLYQKSRLTKLSLVWNSEDGIDADDNLHLETMEGLRPPPQLKRLSIRGYNSSTYPSWLLQGFCLENLESFILHGCSELEGLPLDTELFRHCCKLSVRNVPNLKTLSRLPAGLTSLRIGGCPQLLFVTKHELEQHDQRENMMRINHLAPRFALTWDVGWDLKWSVGLLKSVLSDEYSSLEQLMPFMDGDISTYLQTI